MLVVDIIPGVAVLALLIYRQLAVRPVNASTLRLIAILVVIGVLQTVQFLSKGHGHPLTYAALGGSLVLAASFGAGLGGRRPGLVAGQLADRRVVACLPGRPPGV